MFIICRFAKRKLDEFVFLGNRLQISYAPHFESLSDTKDKLEGRRREVLARLNRKFEAVLTVLNVGMLCRNIVDCKLRKIFICSNLDMLQWL